MLLLKVLREDLAMLLGSRVDSVALDVALQGIGSKIKSMKY
jgi:hypothetical protein